MAKEMLRIDLRDENKPSYLNLEGADRALRNPVEREVLLRARQYRLARTRQAIITADCGAALLYDPLNIRYATDTSNMQVWTMHNAVRYCLIFAEGPVILFDYAPALHLADGFETVDECRLATSWFYFGAGPLMEERAGIWAEEIASILHEHGVQNLPLAVDKCDPLGLDALRRRNIRVFEGQEVMEKARSVKNKDELTLMDWTIKVCEAGMWRMRERSLPGYTENEIWAELHFENIRNGGEWIETRLLAAGPRTNPWFQESSDYVCEKGDLLSFDTDLVGPYGYCCDISRAWTIGLTPPMTEQRELYQIALEQIHHNWDILKPGMSFAEFNEKSWRIPEIYQKGRYSVAIHGVGLCDEHPSVPTHVDMDVGKGYPGMFYEGMVVCVESYIGAEGGREGVKLEIQVLITEDRTKRLDSFPFEDW